jgi:acyl-CoA thioester hydrolase
MQEFTTPITSYTMDIRVRYCETDAMGYLHHSHYINYFEMGRTELFRATGGNYRLMEENGFFFVIVEVNLRYRKPARYDDVLTLKTSVKEITPVKLIHEYEVRRGEELLTTGKTVLACVDRAGQVQRITSEIIPTLIPKEV